MNSVQYIGDGKFVVTEGWLREVFSQAVNMNVADYLGVDNWEGWCDTDEALKELYPDYALDINERRVIQEIKAIANLEHRYNPYNSSWGLVLEYCKQLLEGEKQ